MCLEDLRLGRGRYNGISITASVRTDSVLKGNSKRVAIIMQFSGMSLFAADGSLTSIDFVQLWFGPNSIGSPHVQFVPPAFTAVWRIEDLGSCIQGPISVNVFNASATAFIKMVEILTDENSPSIGFHDTPPR